MGFLRTDDFITRGPIKLRPNDNKGEKFTITVATEDENDGWIAFGTAVSSIVTIAYDKDDQVITTNLIDGTPTVDTNVITVQFKYPTTNGAGRYRLVFILTLDNTDTKETRFDRVYCEA